MDMVPQVLIPLGPRARQVQRCPQPGQQDRKAPNAISTFSGAVEAAVCEAIDPLSLVALTMIGIRPSEKPSGSPGSISLPKSRSTIPQAACKPSRRKMASLKIIFKGLDLMEFVGTRHPGWAIHGEAIAYGLELGSIQSARDLLNPYHMLGSD